MMRFGSFSDSNPEFTPGRPDRSVPVPPDWATALREAAAASLAKHRPGLLAVDVDRVRQAASVWSQMSAADRAAAHVKLTSRLEAALRAGIAPVTDDGATCRVYRKREAAASVPPPPSLAAAIQRARGTVVPSTPAPVTRPGESVPRPPSLVPEGTVLQSVHEVKGNGGGERW
jgi:hypothetical protein